MKKRPDTLFGQFGEMLAPDPAHYIRWIVLVFCQPQLALLRDDVEDLLHVSF